MSDPRPSRESWPAAIAAGIFAFAACNLAIAVEWDGLAFLLRAEETPWGDPAHLLYPAILNAAGWVGGMFGVDRITSGKLLSAFALALGFFLFQRLLWVRGLHRVPSVLHALLLVTMPGLLREGLRLEVYWPSLATMLAALLLATRSRSFVHGLLSTALLGLSATLHAAAVIALPALFVTMPGPGWRSPPRQALCAAVGLGIVAVAAVPPLRTLFVELWSATAGFIPIATQEAGFGRIAVNGGRAGQWVMSDALTLLIVPAVVTSSAAFNPPGGRFPLPGLTLGCSFLIAFLGLGVPVLGLLIPATLGFIWMMAEFIPRRWFLLCTLLVALSAAVNISMYWTKGRREHARPDDLRNSAITLADAVPADAAVLAGADAQHLRYFTGLSVIAIDEIFHRARRAGNPRPDPVVVLREALSPFRGRPLFITQASANRLFEHAQLHTPEPAAAFAHLESAMKVTRVPGHRDLFSVKIPN